MDRSTGGGVVELDDTGSGWSTGPWSGVDPAVAVPRTVRAARRGVGPRPVRPAGSGERAPVLRRRVAPRSATSTGVWLLEGGAGSGAGGVGVAVVVPLRPRAEVSANPSSGFAGLRGPAPVGAVSAVRSGARGAAPVSARRYAVRRAVAVAALGVLSMLVVVALGLVAEAAGAAHARAGVPTGSVAVVVERGDTVWDLARRAAPEADAVAVVERIVAENGLGGASVGVLPAGLVLRVPA